MNIRAATQSGLAETRHYDLAIVGAGIVGLAHALAAARRGRTVVMFDRDAQANGASIRNFGFVTVTGQQKGECWERALRSRDVWAEIAPKAGIEVLQRGLVVAARRPEAVGVVEAFKASDMGDRCQMLTAKEANARVPSLRMDALKAALWSPHELRVESRTAVPKLAAYLEETEGVVIHRRTVVRGIDGKTVDTNYGPFQAERVVVCPGDDFLTLCSDHLGGYALTRCLLHMLRISPGTPVQLPAAVMSDLSLTRYLGYSELPEARALQRRLEEEQPDALENGVHLIVVQSADGSLVVGDSHHYADTPPPFAPTDVDRIILDEMDAVLDLPGRTVSENWTGTYASAPDRLMLVEPISDIARVVIVTSGTGASTAFAIGEEVISDLFEGN